MDQALVELEELQEEKRAVENRFRKLVIRERTVKANLRKKEIQEVANAIVDVDPVEPPYARQKAKVDRLLELIVPDRNRYKNLVAAARLSVQTFNENANALNIDEQDCDIYEYRKLLLAEINNKLRKLTSF